MGLLPVTLAALVEHGLADSALPRLRTSVQLLVGACAEQPRDGREALRLPLESWSANWADLFRGLRVPHYRVQRVCLIGDASTLAPPFTASGVMKAAHQTIELARALQGAADVDAALAAWDARQMRFGDGLHALALQMEQQLIWRTPDFAALDAEAARAWWHATTTLQRQ
jgi:2-polyprenyl-6-methoxyphenol hydroxylase-like FAD-dependent oxidoreductase